jgi:Nucleoside-diphosphate-sugar pyrophosphorylase involved in lipopolysaccharide biosynthesis/translation initiation factor 2B, gamma/epsilon subunits (eIF-2Bgamma/eIF-2Bepsilon)
MGGGNMKKGAVILAAGKGSKLFPYSTVRSKTTLKIAGKPLIRYNAEILAELGCDEIVIVTGRTNSGEIRNCLEGLPAVQFAELSEEDCSLGTSDSLLQGIQRLSDTKGFLVLYGDTVISKTDLTALYTTEAATALLQILPETSRNWIGASVENGMLSSIGAHSRGDDITYRFAGFALNEGTLKSIRETPEFFPDVKVGVAVPRERYLEAGLLEYMKIGCIQALVCREPFFDIDKPWHMLEANEYLCGSICGELNSNELAEGAWISKSADVRGYVKLGKNSFIGDRVTIKGNLIAGDNTVIDNGAIIEGPVIIADNTKIMNYCKISGFSSIGSNCIVDHGAEFLGGVIMDKSYFYHYGEFYGAVGSYTDIGAATVCGTLRFDDRETEHSIMGRKEIPNNYANAVYLGDYCRTGVNAMIMPGCKIGSYSVIGAGVILDRDVEEHSLVYVKQEQIVRQWGEEKYGW